MNYIYLNNKNKMGCIKFDLINTTNDFKFPNINKIEFTNNISELVFVDLLQMCTELLQNIPDKDRKSVTIIDTDGYTVELRILHRNISLEYYFDNKRICTILIDYNLKDLVYGVLEDYKKLIDTKALEGFLNKDKGYMYIINAFYKKLNIEYEDTF